MLFNYFGAMQSTARLGRTVNIEAPLSGAPSQPSPSNSKTPAGTRKTVSESKTLAGFGGETSGERVSMPPYPSQSGQKRQGEGGLWDSLCSALPTETKVESETSQSKSGTSVNLSDSGNPGPVVAPPPRASGSVRPLQRYLAHKKQPPP